jgi:ribosomal-protein-serine acetyltransferase
MCYLINPNEIFIPRRNFVFITALNQNLSLRLFRTSDASELLSLVESNRKHLSPWLPWVDSMQTSSDALTHIKLLLKKHSENGAFDAAILYQQRMVGSIGLSPISWTHRSTMMGYWLAAEAQNKGIMTSCAQRVAQWVFHDLHLHRLEIRCSPANLKSQKIPKKLGFTWEGTLRQCEWVEGKPNDLLVFGMLAPEWFHRFPS